MKIRILATGAFVGGILTAPLIVLMYLGKQIAGLLFAPFDLFNWIALVLPGAVITFGIDLMINSMLFLGINVADSAKIAEQVMALALFLLFGIIAGAIFFWVLSLRQYKTGLLDGIVIGMLFGLPVVVISVGLGDTTILPVLSLLWLFVLFLVWGLVLCWSYRRLYAVEPDELTSEDDFAKVVRIDRRQFLIVLGGTAAAITVVGSGLGAFLASTERRRQEDALVASGTHKSEGTGLSPFPNADDPVVAPPGTRPEYTPLKDHYKVFIELEPTVIDSTTWKLPITGLVDNPLMLTLEDLRTKYQPRHQYITLSCISGRVGTSLIGTTMWTGASLQEILTEANVRSKARYLNIVSADGFHESVDLDLIASDERIMLCYAWDGTPLSVDHGSPLRIWLPDRYGMKQPKWITGIVVTDEYQQGYWVERNWDEIAQVKTTSVIDTVAVDAIIENGSQKLVPIGGIAFSGDRGISKVEVRVDGGSWEPAQLRAPLSETTWVIWRYEWPFEAGTHTFEVRSAEGDGTPQIEEERASRPSGATGIHMESVDI